MEPTRFDQIAQAMAVGISRRQMLLAFAGAIMARVLRFDRSGAWFRPPTQTPPAEPLLESSPMYVSPNPIPLGGGNYLVDGTIVHLDVEAASFAQETPSIPILVNDETVYINPASLVDDVSAAATPIAGDEEPSDESLLGELEAICGFDDSQDVELYRGDLGVSKEFVAGHQSPVGCIRWNANLPDIYADPGTVNARRWCSGTLIAEDLFLTAAHCFAQEPPDWRVPRINGTNEPISRTEIALNMHVDFRYQLDAQGNDQVPVSFPIVELVEDRLGDLDYAIVRVANNPGLTFGLVGIAPADPGPGEMLCIMGHPEGVPKRVEAGPATRLETTSILYDDIDTRGGSSGAGILADTNGLIVGVHTNGGCNVAGIGANRGLRISALLNASPILHGLAAGGTPTA